MKKKIAFLAAIAVCMSSMMATGVWAETADVTADISAADVKVDGDKETSEPGEAPDVTDEPDSPVAGEDQKTEEEETPAVGAEDSSDTAQQPSEGEGQVNENTWHINHHKAAMATAEDKGKYYEVFIENPGGEENGGADKWDVQFRIRGLSIEEGHDYRLTYDISTDTTGYYYTKIGNLDAKTVGSANSGEVWHNQYGLSTLRSFVKGYVIWDKAVDYTDAWSMQRITEGDTMTAVSEFKAIATLPEAEWVFFLGGRGPATPEGCFKANTTLMFTNLTLKDLTTGETLVSYNPKSTTYTPGDVDENGVTDLSDLTLLSQYLLRDRKLSGNALKAADVDQDGVVDVSDAALLKMMVMKAETGTTA